MTDIIRHPEQSADLRAVIWFLITIGLAALLLGWLWHSQRQPVQQAPMVANQPADVGLVQGNTGGGAGF
jgi:hypothetical protein